MSYPVFLLFISENQHFSDSLQNKNNKYIQGLSQTEYKNSMLIELLDYILIFSIILVLKL